MGHEDTGIFVLPIILAAWLTLIYMEGSECDQVNYHHCESSCMALSDLLHGDFAIFEGQ